VRTLPALLLLAGLSHAQLDLSVADGSSSYKMLKLSASSRVLGLSGAGSGLAGTGSDQDQNPAVARASGTELSAGYASLPGPFASGIQHLGWRVPVGPGSLIGRVRYEGFDDLAGYDHEDRSTGDFSVSTWTAGLGYAWNIDSSWIVAGRVQYARNSVERYQGWAVVGDAGIHYSPRNRPWSFGISLLNVGKAAVADSLEEPLPTTVQIGTAWKLPERAGWKTTLLLDFRHPNDEEWTMPVGAEATWSALTLRCGMPLLLAGARPSLGAGIHWESIRLDASVAWHEATGISTSMEFALEL